MLRRSTKKADTRLSTAFVGNGSKTFRHCIHHPTPRNGALQRPDGSRPGAVVQYAQKTDLRTSAEPQDADIHESSMYDAYALSLVNQSGLSLSPHLMVVAPFEVAKVRVLVS